MEGHAGLALHDEVRRYFEDAGSDSAWPTADIAALRAWTRAEALSVRGPLEPVAAVDAFVVAGAHCRLYRPVPQGPHPPGVVVWVHGGGWIHGDLDCYEGVTRAMAASSGAAVLAVEYRLAPELPFPAALDDVWAALRWATSRFDRVAMAGDSSGGNLVAAAAIRARDAGVPLDLQVLVYPVLDSVAETPYKLRFRDRYAGFAGQPDFGSTAFDRIKYIWEQYVPDPVMRTHPYTSPMRAASLRGVAPAVVVTAEHDILRGEAEHYVQRLQADGVPASLHGFPGQIHGFFQMRGPLTDAHRAMELVAAAIRDALRHPRTPAHTDAKE
ncbi:alpha/beta hydrolase [Dactylosporangium sp. CA-092794]|uniref:alpha/beta hydrolase n=1 Tax=Dactylosporangium sp. CA-092794 TaxID=3239929 RepID=UPI003D946F8C